MSITANKWKSTMVGGQFKNVDYVPTFGSTINANATFQRDVNIGGNLTITGDLSNSTIYSLQDKTSHLTQTSPTLLNINDDISVSGVIYSTDIQTTDITALNLKSYDAYSNVINIGDSGVGVCNILSPNTTIDGNLIVAGTLTTSGSALTITDLNVSNNITAGVNISCGSTLQSTDLAVTGVGYFSGSLSAVNAGFPQMQTRNITSYSAFSNVINIGDLTLGATNILSDTLNISGSIVNTVYNTLQNTVSGLVTKCQHQTGNATQTLFSNYTVCDHLQCNDLAVQDWT
jgi:hypothetical protein